MLPLRYSLLLISSAWLFILPLYTAPDRRIGILLILFACCLGVIAARRRTQLSGQRRSAVRIGSHLLVGIGLVITVVLLQAGLMFFYYRIASLYHTVAPAAPLVSGLLRLFGYNSGWTGNVVAVQDFTEVSRFSITLEKMADLPLIFFFFGEAIILVIFNVKRAWRSLVITLAIILMYAVARIVVLIAVYESIKEIWPFWDPLTILISLLPLPLILEPLNRVLLPDLALTFAWRANWRKVGLAAGLALFAVLGLSVYLGYQDPGIKKQGRVMIDDSHSNWEWTTRPFDKEWFGQQSVYNYYLARDFANHYFDVKVNADKPISNQLLDDIDVLVIKTPTEAFSVEENQVIQEFVRRGGGLFLIGDHTNLFGMSTILNDLGRPFEIKFNFDDTFDMVSGQPSNYQRPRLAYHPIARELTDFGFETTCTLDVPLSAEPVIIGYGLGREWIDYGHKNFFGNIRLDPEDDYGLFVQAAAVKYGKGRVVSFSDSTVFSNFSFFWPGKSELFINSLDYLNRQNRFGNRANIAGLAIGIVSLIMFVICVTGNNYGVLLPLYTFVFAALFLIGATLIGRWNNQHYPRLKPRTEYTTVAFEAQYSNIGLVEQDALLADEGQTDTNANVATDGNAQHREANTFRTLYVSLARLGIFPAAKKTMTQALQSGAVVVIINPNKSFAANDLHNLNHFLQNGGRLLLMDSVTNDPVFANQLLRDFNVKIEVQAESVEVLQQSPKPKATAAVAQINTQPDDPTTSYDQHPYGELRVPQLNITGNARPLLMDKEKRVVAAEITQGKGSIVVFVDSAHFSNAFMGPVYKKPNDKEQLAYKDLFFVFENYLLGQPKADQANPPLAQGNSAVVSTDRLGKIKNVTGERTDLKP